MYEGLGFPYSVSGDGRTAPLTVRRKLASPSGATRSMVMASDVSSISGVGPWDTMDDGERPSGWSRDQGRIASCCDHDEIWPLCS
jgi:hypothetical protein